jgi:hypothetical protein
MKNRLKQYGGKRYGSVLVLTVVALMILSALGVGMLAIAYGVRHQAIMLKNEATAMLAAEAGYEKAIFWMSQRQNVLTALYNGETGSTGTINFLNSDCDYSVEFYTFINCMPIYKVVSNGHSGMFNKTVDTLVMQAISGWAMGKCRIPSGATTTTAVNYICDATGCETIDMPLHINKLVEGTDARDIYIIGNPQFLQYVAMGESRYTTGGSDKYSDVMDLFTKGIYFDQPDAKVSDETAVQGKVSRFDDSTDTDYKFTPTPNTSVTNYQPAVQLEFFVEGGVGKVRITDNCTVRGYRRSQDSRTYDFRILTGSGGSTYERYYTYSYHVRPSTDNRIVRDVEDTYVTQSFGEVESEPGGQIFVNGNVIIGSGDPNLPGTQNAVKGKITVVATGNIWVANSTTVDGSHDANGLPVEDNPNVLGLFAQKVVKVVDPGMSIYPSGGTNSYPGPPTTVPSGTVYVPVANHQGSGVGGIDCNRVLPNPMVVEAAITTGGGGWGAENVKRGSYGGRKNTSGTTTSDTLTVRGTLTEAIRGIVGSGTSGYKKDYHLDERLLEGILPGDLGLQGKYIAAPAGWHDYRPSN